MGLAVRHDEALQKTLLYFQRKDQSVQQILAKASHVWMMQYKEDDGQSKWVKLDQEGSLFLVQRDTSPYYRMILINKGARDNVIIDLTPQFVCVSHKPHLQYMIHEGEHSQIWNLSFSKDETTLSKEASEQYDTLYEQLQNAVRVLQEQAPDSVSARDLADSNAMLADASDGFWDQPAKMSEAAVAQRIARAAQEPAQPMSSPTVDTLMSKMNISTGWARPASGPAPPLRHSTDAPNPQAKLQALLAGAQRVSDAAPGAPTPPSAPENAGMAVLRTLKAGAGPSQSAAANPLDKPGAAQASAALSAATLEGQSTQAARAAIRQAVAAMLQSDAVVDLLISELGKVGFRRNG